HSAPATATFNDPLTTGNFSRGRCALTRIPAGVWFEDADNIFQAHVIFFEKGFELLLELYFFLQRTIERRCIDDAGDGGKMIHGIDPLSKRAELPNAFIIMFRWLMQKKV
ncbi:hypothetical protein, partial [Stutzerimonas kunmingensis]|uniref:hypothetical protein n=1 Tax=Stutzerimonas kunmingensis TaxID=1211807 RepID=UPI00241FEC84